MAVNTKTGVKTDATKMYPVEFQNRTINSKQWGFGIIVYHVKKNKKQNSKQDVEQFFFKPMFERRRN